MKRRTPKVLLTAMALIGLSVAFGLRISITPSQADTEEAKQVESAEKICPKCKGPMDTGFIRDYFDSNSFDPAYWSPAGAKQHLFSWGERSKITVFRCKNCSYLESYAYGR